MEDYLKLQQLLARQNFEPCPDPHVESPVRPSALQKWIHSIAGRFIALSAFGLLLLLLVFANVGRSVILFARSLLFRGFRSLGEVWQFTKGVNWPFIVGLVAVAFVSRQWDSMDVAGVAEQRMEKMEKPVYTIFRKSGRATV